MPMLVCDGSGETFFMLLMMVCFHCGSNSVIITDFRDCMHCLPVLDQYAAFGALTLSITAARRGVLN
jgi:hypothetical protein